jgi:hypothetical protein
MTNPAKPPPVGRRFDPYWIEVILLLKMIYLCLRLFRNLLSAQNEANTVVDYVKCFNAIIVTMIESPSRGTSVALGRGGFCTRPQAHDLPCKVESVHATHNEKMRD